jgi:hypothetical protein
MSAIASTSGRLHREFVLLLFLQGQRETDRFLAASRVQLAHSTSDQFHYLRVAFSSQLKSKIGNILAKAASLLINLNIDGVPTTSKSHTHGTKAVFKITRVRCILVLHVVTLHDKTDLVAVKDGNFVFDETIHFSLSARSHRGERV